MAKVVIVETQERTRIPKQGGFERYAEVTFTIDDVKHHVDLPIEGLTAAKIEAAVKERAAELVKVMKKEIKIE